MREPHPQLLVLTRDWHGPTPMRTMSAQVLFPSHWRRMLKVAAFSPFYEEEASVDYSMLGSTLVPVLRGAPEPDWKTRAAHVIHLDTVGASDQS